MAATQRDQRPSSRSSLDSLYNVLADLDENQLQYLVQEVNHTGHQHVPVSQAVSAFETENPSRSLNAVRASMLPPTSPLQRQLSKSQKGKLRVQTMFRTNSMQKMRQSQQPATEHGFKERRVVSDMPRNSPRPATDRDGALRALTGAAPDDHDHDTPEPNPEPMAARAQTPEPKDARVQTPDGPKKTPSYVRVSRPDFDLPPGVTVSDLLQLLESEFAASNSSTSPLSLTASSSLSSAEYVSPASRLSSSSVHSFGSPVTPMSGGRQLKRQMSRLDMALDAERNASGIDAIGLDMLEPRAPQPAVLGSQLCGSRPTTPMDLFDSKIRGEATSSPPVFLEGIFDVLENR